MSQLGTHLLLVMLLLLLLLLFRSEVLVLLIGKHHIHLIHWMLMMLSLTVDPIHLLLLLHMLLLLSLLMLQLLLTGRKNRRSHGRR